MRQREVAAMTDARLPERWLSDRRLSRLSDAHYRSYIQALLFSVSNRTDGVIEPDDLVLIPHFAPGAVNAFLAQELWSARQHGWFITDWSTTQTMRSELEVLENARARERRKKQRQRAKAADDDVASPGSRPPGQKKAAQVDAFVPGDGPGGLSRGTAQEGRKALTGGESQAALDLDGQPLCSICEKRAALGERASGWHDPTLCAFCNDEFSEDIRASYDEEHA